MKMNKKMEMILMWAVMLSLLLQGCMPATIGAGQVEALQPGTTLWIIQRNVDMAWGTIRMQKDNILLLAAYLKSTEAWGFVFLDATEKNMIDYLALCSGGTGNVANCKTMGDLVTNALNNGWKIIDVVPVTVVTALNDGKSWLHIMPNLPILVLPGAILDMQEQILPPAGIIE